MESRKKFRHYWKAGLVALVTAALLLGNLNVPMTQALVGPKPTVTVVGADVVKLTWSKPKVAKVARYRVKYSASPKMTLPNYWPSGKTTAASTFAAITHLAVGTTYYFQVAAFDKKGKKLVDYGTVASGKTKYLYQAPLGLTSANVASTSVELNWVNVSGAPGYQVCFYNVKDGTLCTWSQVEVFTLKGINNVGLRKNTDYLINVGVQQPPVGTIGKKSYTPAVVMGPQSASISVKTSKYGVAAPYKLKISKQTSVSVKVTWKASKKLPAGYRFRVLYSTKSNMKKAESVTVRGKSVTLTRLKSDKSYYVRVMVVDAKGKQKSDRSSFQLAKTRAPVGTLKGSVSGPKYRDVVVLIFNKNQELVKQASVSKKGNFSVMVRPGTYVVKLNYLGSSGYDSAWSKYGTTLGAALFSDATRLQVPYAGAVVEVPRVKLFKGASISGVVVDANGVGVNGVDASSRTARTKAREVEAVVLTPTAVKAGSFKIKGLTKGEHWLRFVKAGYPTKDILIKVTATKKGKLVVTSFRLKGKKKAKKIKAGTPLTIKLF